jgi:hypothetical protein
VGFLGKGYVPEFIDESVIRQAHVQYGHKINISSEKSGFITYLSIEKGDPSDTELFIPVLDFH